MVQFSIPQLERLAMRHGLLRDGISQLLKVAGDKPKRENLSDTSNGVRKTICTANSLRGGLLLYRHRRDYGR